ncbi:MAG: hypothetical protein HY608_08855, partial [Planctomycetes bacterium]|nr:hypothetical protein [Planctomycetota bacterium]
MNAYRAILAAKGWEIRGALRSLRSESRLKTLVLATAMAGLFASMLWFAGLGLHYLRAESYYSSLRVYVHQVAFQVFFFSLGVMLLLSALLTSHAMLFRSRVTPFLLSHPVPPQVVTAARLAEAGAISTWAFLYLSFPLLLAYAIEEGGGLPLVALGGASLFLFAAVPVGIAGVLALALGLGTGRTRLAFWGVVLACTLALGAAIGPMATWRTWLSGVEREAVFQLLDRFSMTQHPLMPSTWLSHAWMRASHGDLGIAAFYVATLASWGIFALALAVSFGGRVLLSARSRVVSGRTARGTPVRDLLVRMSRPVMRVLGGPHAPLLEKDFRVFLRDPAQWAQFLIFVGLLAIYFVNIRRIGGLREEAGWRALVATLNFAATSLTLCTFTSRFVVPMISLEGRRFWVLGLMPLSRTGILRSKFVLS